MPSRKIRVRRTLCSGGQLSERRRSLIVELQLSSTLLNSKYRIQVLTKADRFLHFAEATDYKTKSITVVRMPQRQVFVSLLSVNTKTGIFGYH